MSISTLSDPLVCEQLGIVSNNTPITTGVTSLIAGAGIGVNQPTGNVTVSNSGVTSITSPDAYLVLSGSAGTISITNGGVTSVTAAVGSGITANTVAGVCTVTAVAPLPTINFLVNPPATFVTNISTNTTLPIINVTPTLTAGQDYQVFLSGYLVVAGLAGANGSTIRVIIGTSAGGTTINGGSANTCQPQFFDVPIYPDASAPALPYRFAISTIIQGDGSNLTISGQTNIIAPVTVITTHVECCGVVPV